MSRIAMPCRWTYLFVAGLLAGALATAACGQSAAPGSTGKTPSSTPSDIELVEKLLVARREYQKCLVQLLRHYKAVGDLEREKWAKGELREFNRINKQAFRLELDVPPPTLQASTNIPEANKLYTLAMSYKDKGWNTDYVDNQHRAEIVLQQLLTEYPQSNKISDAAYMLGDIYQSSAFRQYRRAAAYFERCYQWNPMTHFDARLRAARLYDHQMLDRTKAMEIYREITTHETDTRRIEEANKRLADLSTTR
jgi:tetratricopeptide (TPR) repeat protein